MTGATVSGDLYSAILVQAERDADSAPLAKIQIVKGWLAAGVARERVYDVACSDGLQPDPLSHQCPDNGAAVNLADCSISTDRGAAGLSTTWTDPEFNPAQAGARRHSKGERLFPMRCEPS